MTWDGHQYIALSEVLGSERFPEDWLVFRTPLFPLAIKVSIALFGEGPFPVKAVPAAMGFWGCFLLGDALRKIAGDRAAAAALVLLAFYPTLAAFEQIVLTETGSFFFVALALRLAVWQPATLRGGWGRAASLGLVLGVGFYWRQTLLMLLPWLALLLALPVDTRARGLRRAARPALQILLMMALAWGIKQPWSTRFTYPAMSANLTRLFLLRQAVIPPEDPAMAPSRATYRAVIADARRKGFLSGVPMMELEKATGALPQAEGRPPGILLAAVARYPVRYAAGVGPVAALLRRVQGRRRRPGALPLPRVVAGGRPRPDRRGPARRLRPLQGATRLSRHARLAADRAVGTHGALRLAGDRLQLHCPRPAA